MGGGAGISINGRFRVVTDSTMFAMPETGIGLFPDVGGSFFLSKLGPLGAFIGLTGERLKAPEMMYTGLGTHYVPGSDWSSVHDLLHSGQVRSSSAFEDVEQLLAKASSPAPCENKFASIHAVVDRIFMADRLETIMENLRREIKVSPGNKFLTATLKKLSIKSPTSMKVWGIFLHYF